VEQGCNTCHDDLTYLLSMILDANAALERVELSGSSSVVYKEAFDHLQLLVASYADNELPRSATVAQVLDKLAEL
jgi:hypothetical protein